MMKDVDSQDSPDDFFEDLESPRRSGISRFGGVLGKSIVTVVKRTTPDAVKDVWRLASWETTNIRCWRTLIFFLLLIAGAFVSSYTYVFLRREQDTDFEANYDLFAARIEYAMREESDAVALATQNIASVISGAASTSDSTFPFVSQPIFEITGFTARSESTLEIASYTPIVTDGQKEQWQAYASGEMSWIEESRAFLEGKGIPSNSTRTAVNPFIWELDENGDRIASFQSPYLPLWLTTPPPEAPELLINFNMFSSTYSDAIFRAMLVTREGLLSPLEDFSAHLHAIEHGEPLPPISTDSDQDIDREKRTVFVAPVFGDASDTSSHIAGLVHGLFAWKDFLSGILPADAQGVYVVLKNTCNQTATYKVMGSEAVYWGQGDLHETRWNSLEHSFALWNMVSEDSLEEEGHCVYSFYVYPSDELRDVWRQLTPFLFAITAAGAFFLIAITFIIYDRYTIRRNEKIIGQAAKTNKIVASLFPSNVRDRLLADHTKSLTEAGDQTRLKNFLANDGPSVDDMEMEVKDGGSYKTRPIADLFPESSVLYADIAGFTSWSSAREPNQVFTLLETIYRGFDEIAKLHGVYKVETIGDCYVACCGLPEPRADHAVAMCHFALDCLERMHVLVKKLERILGPDTSDLAMRMGVHSGPVTAGVLRGDRSRFQLFGDTVNIAQLMESSGRRDRIQISEATAEILTTAGLGQWLVPRQDTVPIMGKGEMKTFWLRSSHSEEEEEATPASRVPADDAPAALQSRSVPSGTDFDGKQSMVSGSSLDERIERRVDWVAEVLLRLLRRVVAKREGSAKTLRRGRKVDESVFDCRDSTVLEEVQEHIALPEYDPTCKLEVNADSVKLGSEVERQVRSYVNAIASMYRDNHFHNFEHATHVTMSVSKLLARIVAPSDMDFRSSLAKNEVLHDHTYGITSDPLTQFACVFSALIHDVDHTGVPNTVLVREDALKAQFYKGRSVAEQNSVDLSWALLMQDDFEAFREQLYTTQEELHRFRQLTVNSVMATDIMDKDLKQLRNKRWERAFSENTGAADIDPSVNLHRKATIVIEHLIQASDVAHTMQHWHIYRKWNEKLFFEMYEGYLSGRAEKDPSEFWYQGEIGFFDFYIIPLAKKLKNCGVFGVSSDEYLNYAINNRREWEECGRQLVAEYLEKSRNM